MKRLLPLLFWLLAAACVGPRATAGTIQVGLEADGGRIDLSVPAGSTVQAAIALSGIQLGELDRIEPAAYAVLTDGARIQIWRRTERFEVETQVLPFSRQTIRNEGMPQGETRLLQAGANGLEQITYRVLEEEGELLTRQAVERRVTQEPMSEILMVGAQAAHSPLSLEGTLAYLSGGNAWIVEGNTANRKPVAVSGDLDGQVFSLSPNGRWLAFTRREPQDEAGSDVNSLWVVDLADPLAEPLDTGARNVVHFADWAPDPGVSVLAFSTVEPRPSAPGWQANNDLVLLNLNASGRIVDRETLLPTNPGGQYGWWGTAFAWAPDGVHLAYARPDEVGLLDSRDPRALALHPLTPYLTGSDWAWVPGVAWGPNSRTLYLVDHGAPVGIEDPVSSPVFDLVALNWPGGSPVRIVGRVGMFAYPSASPVQVQESGEVAGRLAFLQALTPLKSEASSYRVMVMDRDGSNLRAVFPAEGEPGIGQAELAPPAWSPDGGRLAVLYRGDLWIVDVETGAGQPVTGDGLTVAIDWVP
jgi:hypothetical protein